MTRSAHLERGTKVAISSRQSRGVLTFDLNSHHGRQLSTDTLPSISLVIAPRPLPAADLLCRYHSISRSQRSPSQIYLFSGGRRKKKGLLSLAFVLRVPLLNLLLHSGVNESESPVSIAALLFFSILTLPVSSHTC